MKLIAMTAAGLAALALAACGKPGIEAPLNKGVCWQFIQTADGKAHFNKVSDNVPSLEYCAANLEATRERFIRLGGNRTTINGAYQGQFIFIDPRGIFTAPDLKAHPYLALVRTGDGRLAVPGAVPQDPDSTLGAVRNILRTY